MRPHYPLAAALLAVSLYSTAQIQVSQEPRHHKVFENAWVRILDVHVPPGDTTLFHKHSTPSVFMVLTNTKTGSEVLIEPEKAHFTDGNIFFEGFYDKPRIHRVWNSDTSEFHVMDMELPNPTHQEIDPPFSLPGFRLLFDEKPVRGYRFALDAGSSVSLKKRKAQILIVGLADMAGTVQIAAGDPLSAQGRAASKPILKKGDFLFIPAGSSIDFVNKGTAVQPFAIFELK